MNTDLSATPRKSFPPPTKCLLAKILGFVSIVSLVCSCCEPRGLGIRGLLLLLLHCELLLHQVRILPRLPQQLCMGALLDDLPRLPKNIWPRLPAEATQTRKVEVVAGLLKFSRYSASFRCQSTSLPPSNRTSSACGNKVKALECRS